MKELQKHFIALGYRFDWGKPRIHKELRKLMGRESHESLLYELDLVETAPDLASPYTMPQTYQQAALLFSLDGEVGLATSNQLCEVLRLSLRSGMTVADMGCGIGAVVSWLAASYPDIAFEGIDVADNLISAAKSHFNHKNLEFFTGDYNSSLERSNPYDIIFSVFGISLYYGGSPRFGIDLDTMRDSPGYREIAAGASPAFCSWRKSAKTNCKLFLLIRASGAERMLPIIDVAQQSGWKWNQQESKMTFVFENGDRSPPSQRMPLLVFDAVIDDGTISAEEVRDVFSWYSLNTYHPLDAEASGISERSHVLAEQVLKGATIEWRTKQDYDDGHTAEAIILREGDLVHLLRRATTGYCLLETKHHLQDAEAIEHFRRNPL